MIVSNFFFLMIRYAEDFKKHFYFVNSTFYFETP